MCKDCLYQGNLNFNFKFQRNAFLFFFLQKMVLTKSQLENISKKELIEELSTADDISSKLTDLASCFDDFVRRFKVLSWGLAITK